MIRRVLPHILDIVIAVTLSSVLARAAFVSPGNPTAVPTGSSVLITSGTCPSGFAEDTTARGRYLVAAPSGGTVGGTLGSVMTDLADASYTPVGTNGSTTSTLNTSGTFASSTATNVIVSGTTLENSSGTTPNLAGAQTTATVPAETFTGTANATMRSTVAPTLQVQVCKKS